MEEMFYEISKLFDFAFFGKAQEDQVSQPKFLIIYMPNHEPIR